MTAPLSPEATAILAAINGYGSDSPEIAAWLRERPGGASATADLPDGVGAHRPEPQAGWQPIDPGKEAMANSIARELRRPDA